MVDEHPTRHRLATQQCGAILRIELHGRTEPDAVTYLELGDTIAEAERDRSTRVLLINGIAEALGTSADRADRERDARAERIEERARWRLFRIMADTTKPIVATVQGDAVGPGVVALFHCDLVYAAPETRFRLPFVDQGGVPEGGASYLYAVVAGHQRAAEALLLGRWIAVSTLHDLGRVTDVVDRERLTQVATDVAHELGDKPVEALRATRRLLRQVTAAPRDAAVVTEMQETAARRQLRLRSDRVRRPSAVLRTARGL
jgi:enoyl-CoA hydratase/carnithine racemase